MVRAPCCEKMGLKKGPWTAEEDQILVAYIKSYGHGNWRALPKLAGLLRCGKSCRLRWTNYLRPDIKRGNFSIEEEETIISLHEMLGNRWSMIAARLPGRTDNEIKNVWNTHLKKRLNPNQAVPKSKRSTHCNSKIKIESEPINMEVNSTREFENPGSTKISPARSYREVSCSGTDCTVATEENVNDKVKESFEEMAEIDDSFWLEVLSTDNCAAPIKLKTFESFPRDEFSIPLSSTGSSDNDMDFWLGIFMQSGDLQELPEI